MAETTRTSSKTAGIHCMKIHKAPKIFSCENREATAYPKSWPVAAEHCVAELCAAVSTGSKVKMEHILQ